MIIQKTSLLCVLFSFSAHQSLVSQTLTWQQTSIPPNIYVSSLANSIEGSTFAATDTGGIYVTTDHGSTWLDRNAGLPYRRTCYVGQPTPELMFATIDYRNGRYDQFQAMFRSTNQAASWTQSNTGMEGLIVQSVASLSPGLLIAGGYYRDGGARLFRSTDDGISWTGVNPSWNEASVNCLLVSANGDVLAGVAGFSGQGMYRSSDAGNTWLASNVGLTGRDLSALAMDRQGCLFAGSYGWGEGGVFRSTDDGNSWTKRSTGLLDTNVTSLAVNSIGDVFAGTDDGGVFRSTDDGMTWSNVGLTGQRIWCLSADGQDYLFGGTVYPPTGVIYRTVFPTVDVEPPRNELTASFALHQNYPNPFNSSTIIEFELPRSSHISLRLYNALGEELASVLDNVGSAGVHRVQFDGLNLPSGVYFYEFRAGRFVETKKLILLR